LHPVDAAVFWYVPAGQFLQPVEVPEFWYWPQSQLAHLAA
jgi:hypothetical protein